MESTFCIVIHTMYYIVLKKYIAKYIELYTLGIYLAVIYIAILDIYCPIH